MRVYLAPGILLVLQGEDCAFDFGTGGVLELQRVALRGGVASAGVCGGRGLADDVVSVNACQIVVGLVVVCLFLLKSKSRGEKSSHLLFFLGGLDGKYMAASPFPWREPHGDSEAGFAGWLWVPRLPELRPSVGTRVPSPPGRAHRSPHHVNSAWTSVSLRFVQHLRSPANSSAHVVWAALPQRLVHRRSHVSHVLPHVPLCPFTHTLLTHPLTAPLTHTHSPHTHLSHLASHTHTPSYPVTHFHTLSHTPYTPSHSHTPPHTPRLPTPAPLIYTLTFTPPDTHSPPS